MTGKLKAGAVRMVPGAPTSASAALKLNAASVVPTHPNCHTPADLDSVWFCPHEGCPGACSSNLIGRSVQPPSPPLSFWSLSTRGLLAHTVCTFCRFQLWSSDQRRPACDANAATHRAAATLPPLTLSLLFGSRPHQRIRCCCHELCLAPGPRLQTSSVGVSRFLPR